MVPILGLGERQPFVGGFQRCRSSVCAISVLEQGLTHSLMRLSHHDVTWRKKHEHDRDGRCDMAILAAAPHCAIESVAFRRFF